jgi:hypothetical protein
VQPWMRSSPSFGSRIVFDPVTRITCEVPGRARLRSRNDGVSRCLALNCGNPTCAPLRVPVRLSEKFFNAVAALTEAHSNTSVDTSARQANPREPSGLVGESTDVPFLYAFIALMNDSCDHANAGVSWSPVSP